ncbi:hypothetical protein RRG08_023270 [Elysia crispata]|uniref:Uncharacterized protein n=1 Tax=Elysia crispata TaxID=231223 RepID=A0AAE1AQ88_9GAST|nr:hypothetical protein RRG08_023270 [Elysia crispata]
MKFKPKKSRSLSVRKGKIDATTIFTVASQQIAMVSQKPAKSLGRWYDSSMKDTKRELQTVDYRPCLELLQNRPLTGAIHMEA